MKDDYGHVDDATVHAEHHAVRCHVYPRDIRQHQSMGDDAQSLPADYDGDVVLSGVLQADDHQVVVWQEAAGGMHQEDDHHSHQSHDAYWDVVVGKHPYQDHQDGSCHHRSHSLLPGLDPCVADDGTSSFGKRYVELRPVKWSLLLLLHQLSDGKVHGLSNSFRCFLHRHADSDWRYFLHPQGKHHECLHS